MAFETRYEVSTQVASSTVEERLPAMCGKATLATLVSRTSMNVASITVRAMIHGLTETPVLLATLVSRTSMNVASITVRAMIHGLTETPVLLLACMVDAPAT